MFNVTVAGSYVISGKLAQIDEYEEVFELTEGRVPEARAIIQNSGILDERLRKTKKNYRRWRTCQVIDVEGTTKEATKEETKLHELLVEATKKGCLPATFKRLKRPESKIKALEKAIKNKAKRVAKAKAKKGGMKEEAA